MFLEPIVLLFSIYVAVIYGILLRPVMFLLTTLRYLLFVAFPIIFERIFFIRSAADVRTTRMGSRDWWSCFHWQYVFLIVSDGRHWCWHYSRRGSYAGYKSKLSQSNGEACRRQTYLARGSFATYFHWCIFNANCSFLVVYPNDFANCRFAWTSYPTLHWSGTILAGIPFGLAQILLFLSIMNYLADCYLQYAASALAANSLLRSVLGATFPLWAP